jgi:hypothetical protein
MTRQEEERASGMANLAWAWGRRGAAVAAVRARHAYVQ